nr:DUF2000 family protein [Brevibacterium antiquum]
MVDGRNDIRIEERRSLRGGIDGVVGQPFGLEIEHSFAKRNFRSCRAGHDAANREAVAAVAAEDLNLVGIALRGPKNAVDRVVKGARMHG